MGMESSGRELLMAMVNGTFNIPLDGSEPKLLERGLFTYSSGQDAAPVVGEALMDLINAHCTEIAVGGRMIVAILTNMLLLKLGRQVLNGKLDGEALSRVRVTGGPEGFAYSFE